MIWAGRPASGQSTAEDDGRFFHAYWEARGYAIVRVLLQRRGIINVAFDEMRDAIERIPPAEYLTLSYYDRWLRAAEMLLADQWLLGPTTPRRFSGGNSSRRPEMPGQSLQREPSVRVRASPRLRPRAYGPIADGGGLKSPLQARPRWSAAPVSARRSAL